MIEQEILEKYADLIVNYCVELKKGERAYVTTTTIALPLLKEVQKAALKVGAFLEYNLQFESVTETFFKYADDDLLKMKSAFRSHAFENFDAYIVIRAPFDLYESSRIDPAKRRIRAKALKDISQIYAQRTSSKALKRTICEFPTQASADLAGMSLDEYAAFIFNACKLNEPNPQESWMEVRRKQQTLVDYLNQASNMRYKNKHSDISFSTLGRTWINSDGTTNMPSGEVYTGPVEESVNGHILFDFPSIFQGTEVKGIKLEVLEGKVVNWSAEQGGEKLDEIFAIEGANYFGEAAIGTNYNINRATKNILFDEKIGGTIHMAVGQAYIQTGGKNKSPIHWDMICDMRDGGEIYADDKLIYKDGQFLILDESL